MEQFWKSKKFKALYREWNKNLELSGFIDAEIQVAEERTLKQRATNSYRQASPLERETRLNYYCHLGYLAHHTFFGNEIDKYVMIKHSEGATIKQIVEGLAAQGVSRGRLTIRYIIRRWEAHWGIRRWSLKQMNLKRKATG